MADVLELLTSVGALLTDDHFVYTSGRHGSVYINKDALYPHTEKTSAVGRLFAQRFADISVDTIVGPALGGIILAQWTAHHLTVAHAREHMAVYAEKDGEGGFTFRRGYDVHVRSKRVLVLEDLTTTGGSVRKVVDVVREVGGEVVGVGVMVNRDPKNVSQIQFSAPFRPLAELPAVSYDPADCPLCREHTPINTKVGHGRSFADAQVTRK